MLGVNLSVILFPFFTVSTESHRGIFRTLIPLTSFSFPPVPHSNTCVALSTTVHAAFCAASPALDAAPATAPAAPATAPATQAAGALAGELPTARSPSRTASFL